ncbi:equilibrative nucleoside transporter 1-like [Pollicipes pollicipes]|uniref:equilibrative nucleoside transporter 1-like n=1 Tax=Pollicipes pollicipes TaxID=41117 RepID=UPI00188540FA|nr:equilibrative nucleoside transporter 1-like [Pollicipes pollicipes]
MGAESPEDETVSDGRSGAGSAQRLKEKEVEAMIETSGEPDAPAIVYFIFYLLGMGTLLPWNFFITADSYWNYKFRNATLDANSNATDTTTDLQYNFFAYLSVASMLPNTIFLTLNAVLADKINQQLKLLVALGVVIVFFIVTTILVPVNSDQWQSTFFAITMVMVVILNVGAAVFQGGLFGLSAQFPSKYLSAVLSGQALGAVFACVCRIVSIAVSGDDEVAAAVNSALVYFTLADITLAVSMGAYLWMTRMAFYKYYTVLHGPKRTANELVDLGQRSSAAVKAPSVSVWRVFLKVKWFALAVCLVFLVTLSMFPAITAKIEPMHASTKENPSVWARDYFVPVCCFLLFNLTDYIGRICGGYTVWPKKHQWYIVLALVVLRVVFVPLFMYLFDHDAYYIVIMIVFGLSNGYLATLCMIYGPGSVEPEEQNTASSMMAAFLGLGLCLGALLSNVTIKII